MLLELCVTPPQPQPSRVGAGRGRAIPFSDSRSGKETAPRSITGFCRAKSPPVTLSPVAPSKLHALAASPWSRLLAVGDAPPRAPARPPKGESRPGDEAARRFRVDGGYQRLIFGGSGRLCLRRIVTRNCWRRISVAVSTSSWAPINCRRRYWSAAARPNISTRAGMNLRWSLRQIGIGSGLGRFGSCGKYLRSWPAGRGYGQFW
jgi:hypothetical protein